MTDHGFRRLARGLRAMKFDFTKANTIKGQIVDGKQTYIDNPEAIIQDDVPLEEANLLTSRHKHGRAKAGGKGMHRIVLDIDMDAALIPSTTPGHHHLIIDKVLPWDEYEKLLNALADAGIIQKGYAGASIAKGYTAIRPPWEKKEPPSNTFPPVIKPPTTWGMPDAPYAPADSALVTALKTIEALESSKISLPVSIPKEWT